MVFIDSLSLVPNSLLIPGIENSFYSYDPERSLLTWKKTVNIDSVTVIYRVFRLKLEPLSNRVNYDSIKNRFIMPSILFKNTPKELVNNELFSWGHTVNYRGSYGRSVGFGNQQDAVFNSQLNLQINGTVGDSIQLNAIINDNSIPVQPDGNTRQLNELDKVLLQFKKKNWEINMGDIDLEQRQNYFLHFYKRLQGVSYIQLKKNEEEGADQLLLSAAMTRGKYFHNIFQGMEGNQGPYRLQGPNNEPYFVVIANTERVFIDGELLQRGQEYDYLIDYNSADITFTSKRLITRNTRIQIEFEYSDRNFLNSLFYISDEKIFSKKFRLNIAAYDNSDAKNSPINQNLDNRQKQFLADIGDSVQNAFYPSAYKDSFSALKIQYAKVKSPVSDDSVYRYTTNPDSALYSLSFIEVGVNKGNYKPIADGANGIVYQWIAPVNGVLQGNFEPAVFLVTPKRHRLMTLNTEYHIGPTAMVKAGWAWSNYDVNTYSSRNKGRTEGYAAKVDIQRATKLYINDHIMQVKTAMGYEWVDEIFKPVEDLHNVEFLREWGLSLTPSVSAGHLAYAAVEARDNKGNYLLYNLSVYLRSDGYKGVKQSMQYSCNNKGWLYTVNFNLTNNSTPSAKGVFSRPSVEISKSIPRLNNYVIGAGYTMEQNVQRNIAMDSLTSLSLINNTFCAFIRSNPRLNNHWSVTYSRRMDEIPCKSSFKAADKSHMYNFSAEVMGGKRRKVKVNATYRQLFNSNSVSGRPDNTLLGNIEYQFNEWKGGITGSALYETGSGQEQRKSFVYVEAIAGQGQYVWNDYNRDGVAQLNEFEPALFSDQGRYTRIFTPTNEYIKTDYTRFNCGLTISPAVIGHSNHNSQFSRLLERIKLQTTLRAEDKILPTGKFKFNPFPGRIADSNLVSLYTAIGNTFSFNQFNTWGFDVSNGLHYSKSLFTYGFESLQLNEWNFHQYVNIHRFYRLAVTEKFNKNELSTPLFTNRNYQLKTRSCEPEFNYTCSSLFRLRGACQFEIKENLPAYGGERSIITSFNLSGKLNTVNNISMTGSFIFNKISFNGTANTSVSYLMLNGLSPGKNYLWNIEFTKRLINNLEFNFYYEGRKPGNYRIINTGKVSVHAFL